MKNLFSVILMLLMVSGLSTATAQDLSKGHLKMEVTDVSSDNPEMAMGLDMMKGTEMDLYFSEEKSLMSMNMMGGMMNIKTITDNTNKKVLMLMDMMGQKMKNEQALQDLDAPEVKETMDKMQFDYDKSDTKKIAGFDCYKMTISGADMNGVKMVAYVTEEIKTNASAMQGIRGDMFKGFPLEYSITSPDMNMTFSATAFNKDFDMSVFDIDTSQYKEMTEDQMKQMGGGFGF